MRAREGIRLLWWLIYKDLTRELRALHVLPGMTLLGLVLVFLLATQLDLPMDQKMQVAGGLLWMAICFAGTMAFERSFTDERDGGCWQTLLLYPITPSVLFAAKLAVNFVALAALELIVVPVFIVFSDVAIASRPDLLLLLAALSNAGFAAAGTIVSGLTANLRHRSGLLALVLLPLVVPVLLASAEATGLLLTGRIDSQWWLRIQLLAVFAAVFTIVGALVFEFVLEE
jgi:heme exporter protein B